jgi:hypothetical protein
MTMKPDRIQESDRQSRTALLKLALETANGSEPRDFDRSHRFEAALIDVMVNAVMDRTLIALQEASDYLLDKGIL